jgi:hypothetical protein
MRYGPLFLLLALTLLTSTAPAQEGAPLRLVQTIPRFYIAGGAGALSIVAQEDADHYTPVATLPTAAGTRTALWVPERGRLYLAVPHRGAQGAEIRAYAIP